MKLTADEIFYINTLYEISGAHAQDCLINDSTISFLVKKKDLGKAIGKNAANVSRLERMTKKHIEMVEHCSEVTSFLRKSLYKIKAKCSLNTEENGKNIALVELDAENRRKLMNNMGRLKRIKELAKRNYKVDDVRIK